MKGFIILYWGTASLMYLSQIYYPVEPQLDGRHIGKHHFALRRSDVFMVIVIAWMTCFSFLRTDYNDTYTYRALFAESESLIEGFSNGTFTNWTANPWSMLYRSLIHDLTDNYHIYFFFPAFLSTFAMVKLCKRFSVNPGFSLLIFYSIGTYALYIAALKQSMAVPILILALPYALDKKYVRFYLLVVIACLFHTHAFMFALIPFLMNKPWGKTTWLLLGAVLLAIATYDSTLGAFLLYTSSIGFDISEIEVFDGHSINFLRVAVYWVPACFALVFRRRLFEDSTKEENLFANMSIVSAFILTIGLAEGANMYARMAGYFEIATAITLPWMIKKLFNRQSAKLVTTIAIVFYFIYFLYEFAITKSFDAQYKAITLWQFIQSLFG